MINNISRLRQLNELTSRTQVARFLKCGAALPVTPMATSLQVGCTFSIGKSFSGATLIMILPDQGAETPVSRYQLEQGVPPLKGRVMTPPTG